MIVGAGLSGAAAARELAEAGYHVSLIDKREHIAGNAFDFTNEQGIRVHRYGPHLFHTSNQAVVDWLTRFTAWVPYKHKVKALLEDGRFVTLPVNRETVSMIGEANVASLLYKPYTRKMWGLEMEQLDHEIFKRIAARDDLNEYYFPNDTFQALPESGYTALVERILDHPRIDVRLCYGYVDEMYQQFSHTFNSMPIDEFFNFVNGRLPYRSIKFHTFTIPVPRLYPVPVVNFTHDGPYTRVTEWSQLPGNPTGNIMTTITVEQPCADYENGDERYYPVKDVDGSNKKKYSLYRRMVPNKVTFIGRCGLYVYLDMDQAVSSSLSTVRRWLSKA